MNEHQQILEVLQTYFQSIFIGNVEQLRSVFHPRAALFGEVKGVPYQKSLDDYLSGVAGRKSPQSLGEAFEMKPLSIDVLGPIAMVRTHCPMLGFNYIDFLSFVRVDDRWLITNKTFTHVAA